MYNSVFSAAVTVCQDTLYVIRHSVEYLEKTSTSWTTLQVSLPFNIGIQSCVSLDSKIYFSGTFIKDIYSFETKTNVFEKLGSYTEASGPLALIGRTLFCVGGLETNAVEQFDLDTFQLHTLKSLDCITQSHSVVTAINYPQFRTVYENE